MKRTLYLMLMLSLLLTAFSMPVSAKGGKIDVCHRTENDDFHLINISENAVDAHLAHGDSLPGTNDFDDECRPLLLTDAAGGPGGYPFALDCPAGEAAVGIKGYLGPVTFVPPTIGTLKVVCESGAVTESVGWTPETITPYDLSCPSGTVITGLEGSTHDRFVTTLIENLSIQCAVESGAAKTVVGPAQSGPITDPFALSCPTGTVAVGLQGRSGLVIDQIQVRCRDLQ